jgi:UDP:flavonoid glycosyltransferase YjiC (YdhE family)
LADEARLEYGFLPGGPSAIPSEANSPWRLFRALVKYLDQIAPQLAEQTLAVCDDADLVVENPLSHTRAVERLKVPWCMTLLMPLMPTSAFPAPGLPALPFGPGYNRLTHIAAYRLAQLPLFRWAGLASEEITFPWQEVARNRPALFAFSPSVIPRPQDWSSACHVTGYWFWERAYEPPSDLLTFLHQASRPVALAFGSMSRFAPANAVQLAAEAAHRAGRALLVIGEPPEPMPDDSLALKEVDHTWLFPQLSAVIHHGGAGTTAAAMRAGVPQVVAPFFADQSFWADRAHALGVAPKPIPMARLRQDMLNAALDSALTDSRMQDQAAELGAAIRSQGGVDEACGILEGWVAGGAA